MIRGVKIGGNSRMKVLAEIMDAHRGEDIRGRVEQFFSCGADIVDLGFGFDATPADVKRVFSLLEEIDRPLAVDTQDPGLIRRRSSGQTSCSASRRQYPGGGKGSGRGGGAAVVVPGNARSGKYRAGTTGRDPVSSPIPSSSRSARGLSPRFGSSRDGYPLFFGAGNVVELLDADSIGVNALLAGMAMEAGASIIFTSEHSDKTQGSP